MEIEEHRYPGHGRRRRRRGSEYVVEDQRLLAIDRVVRLRHSSDLRRLIACPLPEVFHTADLAAGLAIPRWVAQRMAYCLRWMGAARVVGSAGNTRLYRWAAETSGGTAVCGADRGLRGGPPPGFAGS